MTVEEALFALVAGVAIVLMFLGLADALEGDARARFRARRRALARRMPPRPRPEIEAPRGPRPVVARRPVREAMPREATPPVAASEEEAAARAAPVVVPVAREAPPRRPSVVESPPIPAPVESDAPEWRDRAAALMRGREWGEARRVVEEALADGAMKPDMAEYLLDVCSIASARELWRLRRATRRGTGDEAPLQGALAMTRLLLDSPPPPSYVKTRAAGPAGGSGGVTRASVCDAGGRATSTWRWTPSSAPSASPASTSAGGRWPAISWCAPSRTWRASASS